MRDWNLGGLAGSLWRKDPPETADKLSTAAAVIRNFNCGRGSTSKLILLVVGRPSLSHLQARSRSCLAPWQTNPWRRDMKKGDKEECEHATRRPQCPYNCLLCTTHSRKSYPITSSLCC